MTPYTYADSPIVLPDDPGFDGGPVPGAPLPEALVGDGYLSDRLGPGFTLITFDPSLAETVADSDLVTVVLQPGSQAAEVLAAGPRSAYLVRPDGHIASRWMRSSSALVFEALKISLGRDRT